MFLWYFSFETVRFRTVLYEFAMFSSNCIVILLSLICYRLKSTNSLKYYNIHKALQFPYKQKVVSCLESLLHFHLKDRYGLLSSDLWIDTGFHCGECLEVLIDDQWVQTRMEMNPAREWYLVGTPYC